MCVCVTCDVDACERRIFSLFIRASIIYACDYFRAFLELNLTSRHIREGQIMAAVISSTLIIINNIGVREREKKWKQSCNDIKLKVSLAYSKLPLILRLYWKI